MAQKVRDVMFEEFPNQLVLRAYTDAAQEQLEDIEGICGAEKRARAGYTIHYDPRYSLAEIKQEIEALTTTSPKDN